MTEHAHAPVGDGERERIVTEIERVLRAVREGEFFNGPSAKQNRRVQALNQLKLRYPTISREIMGTPEEADPAIDI